MDEEEQHRQAFGRYSGISEECRILIDDIKNNDNDDDELTLQPEDARHFTNLAWTLLGKYIANNAYLSFIRLDGCSLTDEKMAALFTSLTGSDLQTLDVDNNEFGIEGLRTMVPFLENSPTLSTIYFMGNDDFNSECFELLFRTLHMVSSRMETMYFRGCSITDITALETYTLPNLKHLGLNGNDIGRRGFNILSNLLQQKSMTLTKLSLSNTGIDDEGAEILANSLKHNTTLKEIDLSGNNITERGCRAFIKLVNDISSIESTYNSNHTLTICRFARINDNNDNNNMLQTWINDSCRVNNSSSPHTPGRAKVIHNQLNSLRRKKLCQLQGVEFTSIGNLFADIEPVLLPNILAMIGEEHGQSDLYTALIPTAPDLFSFIDMKAMIESEMEKNNEKIGELTAKNNQLSQRLALMKLGDSKQSKVGGRKRQMSPNIDRL